MEKISGGVTAPMGFYAAGIAAGIKEKGKDLAMIYSEKECRAAGTFTSNLVKAAPVKWDQKIVSGGGPVRAVVINSGIANACTGSEGMRYCEETAAEAAERFGFDKKEVLVASTGLIGAQVPIEKIKKGIGKIQPLLSHGEKSGTEAATAIMTTDTVTKEAAVATEIGGKKVTVGGMCKGSGMIHPNMCTMLSFVMTDVNISGELLKKALSESVKESYNMVSVDGDTSTNDTCLLLANGLAENPEITKEGEDFDAFCEALASVNITLAKKMAADGEGASKLFEVKAVGAPDKETAVTISKSVVSSNLTKAAIFGHDANWGRILCAMGYSGAQFDPDKVDLYFESAAGKIKILTDGLPEDFDEDTASAILTEDAVTVICDLKSGNEEATAWGCDLTYDYVRINAEYRS